MALVTKTSYPHVEPTSLVYKATHDGEGNTLPFMHRSFISFSYGGKNIEDFDLIVVTNGDRRSGSLYADFLDNVTESDILDENFFWSSHFNGNSLSLDLSTDGITENTLEEFKQWFKPGVKKELVLSEHPNRGILARVSAAPQYNLLPFEKKAKVNIGGLNYDTSTTIYRGDISISFAMEDPYWYSLSNVLYYKDANDAIDYDSWLSAKGIPSFIYQDPDAAKVVLEDNVPINAMLKYPNMFIGSNVTIDDSTVPNTQVGFAEIDSGRVGPLFVDFAGLNIPYDDRESYYFYYAGTAPEKPILTFTLVPLLNASSDFYYISSPYNSFRPLVNDTVIEPFNTITIQSTNILLFKFTTPSIWTGYNLAISIFEKMDGQNKTDIRKALRMGVNHYAPRNYAINTVCGNGTGTLAALIACGKMRRFLLNLSNQMLPATFTVNSKTGKVTGIFSYRIDDTTSPETIEEEVGDMVRSDYLIITDRNHPVNGYIEKRTDLYPDYSYILYHNVANGLQNVFLEYTNKYY